MGLMETVFTGAIIGIVLIVLVVVSGTLRAETGLDETRQALGTLRTALQVYLHEHPDASLPQDCEEVLAALLSDPRTAEMIDPVQLEPRGTRVVALDGFGNPIVYYPAPGDRRAAGGFCSAGPDGLLGADLADDALATRAATDDLYCTDMEVLAR